MTKTFSSLQVALVGALAVVLLAVSPATALAKRPAGGGVQPTAAGCSTC